MREVYIAAVDMIRFGRYIDSSIKELSARTVAACLKEAGLEKSDIQALWFSNSGWGETGQICIRGQVALRPMGIGGIPITNVENACAGGSTALHHAWMGVASGLYDITMAVGAEKLYSRNKMAVFMGFLGGIDIENVIPIIEKLMDFKLTEDDYRQIEEFRKKHPDGRASARGKKKPGEPAFKRLRDSLAVAVMLGEKIGYANMLKLGRLTRGDHSPFMDVYGYAARKHMKTYGSTIEQLAAIAAKNHFNSTLNSLAQYQFDVPVEKVLADRIVSWPLTRAMCAPSGTGRPRPSCAPGRW